jgi:polyphosphate kinase
MFSLVPMPPSDLPLERATPVRVPAKKTRAAAKPAAKRARRTAAPDAAPVALLDRDLSLLAFNERVMSWAARADVPLLERLRYLVIVSSNLDEFFEVRVAPHLSAFKKSDLSSRASAQTYEDVSARAQALVAEQYKLYNDSLLPALERKGIRVVPNAERNQHQRRWVKDFFLKEVQPLLVPIGLDPAHPFPQVANKSLNFIVRLAGKDAFGRSNEVAIVRVPRSLPRFMRISPWRGSKQHQFVSISSVIRAHLNDLFPGREVTEFSQFRVTRHSDLAVDEDEVKNLRTALRSGLQSRHYGQAVRLEVSAGCSQFLSDFLLRQFDLPEAALFRVPGPVNLVRLNQLIDLVDTESMRFARYTPVWPKGLKKGDSLLDQVAQRDVLLHHPYESFDPILELLRDAIDDPNVLAIKQTIYRTGSQPELLRLLRDAVRKGKDVTVVVELKARFDEENNINHTEFLEAAGAQVVYGVVGLKTHAKMMLITRREGRKLVRYAHIGTGNYNAGTARAYTDIGMMTAAPELTADVEQVFLHLASPSRVPKLKKALLAPFTLHKAMLKKLDQAAEAAAAGRVARVMCKMNSLTDEPLVRALLRAGAAGVKVDLVVRGACILPPGLAGVSDNIRVVSVIGRFLEHSRVFCFEVDGQQELWVSSADFMNRNMLRRIEFAWPINEPELRDRVIRECLSMALDDRVDGWELGADGRYRSLRAPRGRKRVAEAAQDCSMQARLMAAYSNTPMPS